MLETLLEKICNKVASCKGNMLSQWGRLILIKYVLLWMANHTLDVLLVPLVVTQQINSILTTFFEVNIMVELSINREAWDKLRKPIEECGIGVKNLLEVKKSLHMKFAWLLLIVKILWTKFFRAKYVKFEHLSQLKSKPMDSHFWKSIYQVLHEVNENCGIKVCEGNIYFWFDRWLNS